MAICAPFCLNVRHFVGLKFGPASALVTVPGAQVRRLFDVTPAGQRFVIVEGERELSPLTVRLKRFN